MAHHTSNSGLKKQQHYNQLRSSTFNRASDLKSHYRMHSGKTSYKCEGCQFHTNRQAIWTNQYTTHSGRNIKLWTLLYITTLNRTDTLKLHSWVQSGVNPHKCEVWLTTFKWTDTFKQHFSAEKTYTSEVGSEIINQLYTKQKTF